MAIDREKFRKGLYERTKESYERKDQSGRFKGILIDDLPDGFQRWKVNEGDHIIDIIPFEAGKGLEKSIIQEKVKEGDPVYTLEIWVHRNVGPTDREVVCNARFFGTRCSICEIVNGLYEKDDLTEAEEKLLNKYTPKRRTWYNIVCSDNEKERAKGVQFWDAAHWNFERHIIELAQLPHGGGYIDFSNPDEGKSIGFKRKGMGATSTEFLKHQFFDREPIPDSWLEQAYQLDSLVEFHTFEQVFEMFFQVPYDGQAVTLDLLLKPSQRMPRQETPSREAPRSEPVKTEDTETTKEETKEDPDNPCPSGHKFGEDLDKTSDCKPCKKWDDCADENDRIQLAAKREKRKQAREETTSEAKTEKPTLRRG